MEALDSISGGLSGVYAGGGVRGRSVSSSPSTPSRPSAISRDRPILTVRKAREFACRAKSWGQELDTWTAPRGTGYIEARYAVAACAYKLVSGISGEAEGSVGGLPVDKCQDLGGWLLGCISGVASFLTISITKSDIVSQFARLCALLTCKAVTASQISHYFLQSPSISMHNPEKVT